MGRLRKVHIVFMGTPEFAVPTLDSLLKNGYNVAGVVTVADKPAGRGQKVVESPVKQYAVEHGLPVLQPVSLRDPEFLSALRAWNADIFVVVAFRMLPQEVWQMPRLGTFNLHAALLPQYRGAAPINWAVINGDRMTGVTTFMINEGMDTGHIIFREQCRISVTDTAGDIHDKMMDIGANLVLQTVDALIDKNFQLQLQKSFIQGAEVLRPAPKITKELCHIDWNDGTKRIYNLIRGLSPHPGAFTQLISEAGETVTMKIYASEMVVEEGVAAMVSETGGEAVKDSVNGHPAPGTVLSDGKTYFAIATSDGAISITDLQIGGKKRMDVRSFLAGFREPNGYRADNGTSAEFLNRVNHV
ncbi:MAG: methionyl-tRNA formyltransferase [Bacteroidales bacterium]|nr:methionyl-tRNA formyltransferase [Bacteroidales bacterium]